MVALYIGTLVAWVGVVAIAARLRGRGAAIFIGVLLGIYSLVAATLARSVGWLLPAYVYAHATVYVSFLLLAYHRMRPLLYRVLVGWPAALFLAGTMIAFPWAIASILGFRPVGVFIPYLVALLGFADTFFPRRGVVHVNVRGPSREGFGRSPRHTGVDPRPLRVVQITDPHIGSFMSVNRLRRVCERAVASNPDLVLLTGDFLTIESNSDRSLLRSALSPLKQLEGKCFACFGNHDHEAPAHVRDGLASAGITLLVDAMVTTETPVGPVEILGYDYCRMGTKEHVEGVTARFPRTSALRIAMLHDPSAFRYVPDGSADLVLSGHTHGGQLGLLWLGLPHTIVSAITSIPDHGLWASGKNLLYVHRGTGHYGFPLRMGVPPEESILEIHRPA